MSYHCISLNKCVTGHGWAVEIKTVLSFPSPKERRVAVHVYGYIGKYRFSLSAQLLIYLSTILFMIEGMKNVRPASVVG